MFSIIIPTFNNLNYLKLCIESIKKNSEYDHELLFHINEGTDGSLEYIKEKKYKYSYSKNNQGVCVAFNEAAKLAKNNYIVLAHDDMYFCPGWDTVFYNEIKNIVTKNFFLSGTMVQNFGTYIKLDCGKTYEDFNERKLLKELPQIKFDDFQGTHWQPSLISLKTWNKEKGYKKNKNKKYKIIAIDYGIKKNILRCLSDLDCKIKIVPAKTSSDKILKEKPDGIFLSNGPGDPAATGKYAISIIQKLINSNVPIFGICLGHQLLAIASGAKTVKMKFGHHGANHPVKDLKRNVVMITSQNHGFAVDESSLPDNLEVTHISLFDKSLQGIHRTDKPAFSFQGHPEASPGPHEAAPLFDHFIELIEQHKQ